MEEGSSKTYVFGQDSQVPAWMAMNNGFGNGFGGGLGGGILGFLLGLFFGNGWGGFGGFGNGGWGGNSGAGFLSNQINNDSGRELLMNAINSNGEASRTAIQNLASMVGQDFNLVNNGVSAIRDGIAALTAQTGMSTLQIVNAIQSGDSALQSKLCECCCNIRLLTVEQGYQSQIATLNQTNQLGSQADRNTNSIISAINAQTVAMNDQFCAARERDMQDKINTQADIITQLRGQLDNDRQTAQINALIAPLYAQVNSIAAKMPQTVPVVWPNLTATEVTPTTPTGA